MKRSKGFEEVRSFLNYVEIINGVGPFSEGFLCDSKRNENGHISKYFTNFFELAHLLPYDAHVRLLSDVDIRSFHRFIKGNIDSSGNALN